MTNRRAPFLAGDIARAVRGFSKATGVPAATVAVKISLADGSIVVSAGKNNPFTDDVLDRGLLDMINGQKVLHSPVTD